ncbi:MAG: YgiT-type zinc finger domain-containing protein [Chloroflexi bacterium HGW-Chloroflexi-1]|nr:MAG: YgiT-type zinc finger domain-containing protein [Chloroflexi bacterium HGW-Chloroflexi-1]
MSETRCYICGHRECEERSVTYVYRRHGDYLIVRDVPCEVCLHCGERYYAGTALLEIERRFMAIYEQAAQPYQTVQASVVAFA